MTPMTPQHGGKLPALDGIRALAVVAVLAYHCGMLDGGYLGVDVFFVLSGFLITALLLGEHAATGRIAVRAFWVRRAFRLLPAVLAYLLAGAVLVLAVKTADDQRDFFASAGAAVVYLNNWWRVANPVGGGAWTQHLWSLSVEQQFYLLAPLLLAAALRRERVRARLPWVLGALIALVVVLRPVLLLRGAPETRIYFGTDTRADALLVGCLLAVLRHRGLLDRVPTRTWTAASWPAWLVVLVAMVASPPLQTGISWLTWGGYSLVAAVAAVGIGAAVLAPGRGPARLFTARPLVWLGGISYAFYLWHYPVAGTLRPALGGRIGGWTGGVAVLVLAGVVSTGLAWVSGRFLERPVARRRPAWAADPARLSAGAGRPTPLPVATKGR